MEAHVGIQVWTKMCSKLHVFEAGIKVSTIEVLLKFMNIFAYASKLVLHSRIICRLNHKSKYTQLKYGYMIENHRRFCILIINVLAWSVALY